MNIVLIGMPGSGKTTIGAEIARILKRKFIDVDIRITEVAGMSIPEIFSRFGEAEFRRYEREQTLAASRHKDCVIATGGGVVKDRNNYYPLHETGYICQIHRNLSLLPTEGRPLSQSGSLEAMYEQRRPMYEFFRDYIVHNDSEPIDTAKNIIDCFGTHCRC